MCDVKRLFMVRNDRDFRILAGVWVPETDLRWCYFVNHWLVVSDILGLLSWLLGGLRLFFIYGLLLSFRLLLFGKNGLGLFSNRLRFLYNLWLLVRILFWFFFILFFRFRLIHSLGLLVLFFHLILVDVLILFGHPRNI